MDDRKAEREDTCSCISSRRGIMAIRCEAPNCSSEWERLLPVTNPVTDTAVILPLCHEMTETEQDYVVDFIAHIARGRK